MTLTNGQIGNLIAARNAITDITTEYPNWKAVDHIDAVLREVPVGQRPEVDKLLGRRLMSAEQLAQLADMADDIEESPKDWTDMRGDTAL